MRAWCVCTGYSAMNWCVLYCTWYLSAICCGYCRTVRSVAVWLLGVGMWYWKHRVSGYVLGGRRLVVWRAPQSRRWCFLWESWDHYLLRSCRIHSGTLWFHISPLWIVESVWVVCCMCWCLVLCLDAVIAVLLYWVAIDINFRRNVNMLGVAGMGKIGSSRVEGTYLPL